MPRRKLSEYKSKDIINKELGLTYEAWSIDTEQPIVEQLSSIKEQNNYVVKVDEGVKGRFKKGLVKLNILGSEVEKTINELKELGYRFFIVENMSEHENDQERYVSITMDRAGIRMNYSKLGGINIEDNQDSVRTVNINDETNWQELATNLMMNDQSVKNLIKLFKDNFFAFLEINPYTSDAQGVKILDAAVEVDDAGAYFVTTWKQGDFRSHRSNKVTKQEEIIEDLDLNSPASFNLSVLNPNGGIFLLLSGGGASVVVADEIFNQGFGKELANYGEYSGNPNE